MDIFLLSFGQHHNNDEFPVNTDAAFRRKANVAMYGMFIGTGTNIILDPIFIQVLGYGVKGAAIATLIGQGWFDLLF